MQPVFQQKGRSLGIDNMEALTLLGIMLLSGYSRLPYPLLHWSESADAHNSLVSDSLYFKDNTNLSGVRYTYYKVRPIFKGLTSAFKQADLAGDISIDETMILYFGKHGTKRFIRDKPIRLSFNLWPLQTTFQKKKKKK